MWNRAVDAGLEQRDLLHDVPRVREDRRDDDASKVVREVVLQVSRGLNVRTAEHYNSGIKRKNNNKVDPREERGTIYSLGILLCSEERSNQRYSTSCLLATRPASHAATPSHSHLG